MSAPERLPIRIGGVMRCCFTTLDEHVQQADYETPQDGDVLPCRWCGSSLIVRNGVWEWYREAEDA